MANRNKQVLIVGGGTAGWLAACYLNARINQHRNGSRIQITLIESPSIPRIGVGEATIPTLINTLQTIGFSEREFMVASDASFKQGIKFVNWLHPGHAYYHPFDRRAAGSGDNRGLQWAQSQRNIDFAYWLSTQAAFCDAGLAPKGLGQADYQSPLAYAYHLNAEKFADLLRSKGLGQGIVHRYAEVQGLERNSDSGDIRAVLTDAGERLSADLFIDCSGLRGLLIDEALQVPHVDYSPWLLCDRAVTLRVPFSVQRPDNRKPYTTATARSAGWSWDIPLADRRGLGYVYSSQFISDTEAEAELRRAEGAHSDSCSGQVLRFRVGRRAESWRHNCVALGLASGFIEPLESTGIYLVEYAAALLCEYFPHGDNSASLQQRFNRLLQNRYEEILNFIVLHYCLSQRDDTPFWREVRKPARIPAALQELFELWREKACSHTDFHDAMQLFGHMNYEYILYGMQFPAPPSLTAPSKKNLELPTWVKKELTLGREKLPLHNTWLRQELDTRN
ncbi:MAG: tryptophan 7-halogenase [Cellvibrionaceae bacterium]|nr:tryptophan 7-halogenase [Cellvibrionaceae bacterium]